MKRLIKIIAVLVVGIFVSYRRIRTVDHEMIFDDQINFLFLLIAIGFFLGIIFSDRKDYSKTKSFVAFIPTCLGLLIGIGLMTTLYQLTQRDKSPTILYCITRANDFNGVAIDFREDGTFKLTNWCLGVDYYRGSYTIKDSIITLDKTVDVIKSNRLLIRQDGIIGGSGKIEKSVYQIDEEGQIMKDVVDFSIRREGFQ